MALQTSVGKYAFFKFCICFIVMHVKRLKVVTFKKKTYSDTLSSEVRCQKLDEQIG